ncbi:MAG: flavodoxin domain-containing protein, partial [Candidatus Hodarchaeales archaeon]
MSKKVLIAYGSRYGSTEEISINFKETLEEKGFLVDFMNLRYNKTVISNIANYSGVLIGSGIRIARWTKEAKNFLKRNVNHLNENETLVGIFLSSGEASDPETRPDALDKYLVTIFKELGL